MINGKWAVLILWHLRNGCLRYSEIQKKIPTVTQKVLTQQLRHLESCNLVVREVYPEVPPRVEYSLSENGRTLIPILIQLNEWGWQHLTKSN